MMTITLLKNTESLNAWATIEVSVSSAIKTIDGGSTVTAYSLQEVLTVNKGERVLLVSTTETNLPKGYTREMATDAAMRRAASHCDFGYAVV